MKNEALKQANELMNWLEMKDTSIDDVIVTIKLKNDKTYKIMNDGSIVSMSSSDSDNKAFANAQEIISAIETKSQKSHDAKFDIMIDIDNIKQHLGASTKDCLQSIFTDMIVKKVNDEFAFLTYNGDDSEEPSTVAADIRLKYGVKPFSIKKS